MNVEGAVTLDFRTLCASINDQSINVIPKSLSDWLESVENPAIAEISGGDSVAAIIRAVEEEGFDGIIPTIASTGVEYGDPSFIAKNIKIADDAIDAKTFNTPILFEDLDFWRALNGRFTTLIWEKFGVYSPCLGCHLYLHAVRVPLALKLGVKTVISGERELHNDSVKINQLPIALDSHEKLLNHFGIGYSLPLRKTSDTQKIIALTKGLCGKDDQFKCLYSGNYRDAGGKAIFEEDKVSKYYLEFGLPATINILESLISDSNTNPENVINGYF